MRKYIQYIVDTGLVHTISHNPELELKPGIMEASPDIPDEVLGTIFDGKAFVKQAIYSAEGVLIEPVKIIYIMPGGN